MVWLDARSVSDGGTLPPDPRCIGVGGVLQANGIFETGESEYSRCVSQVTQHDLCNEARVVRRSHRQHRDWW